MLTSGSGRRTGLQRRVATSPIPGTSRNRFARLAGRTSGAAAIARETSPSEPECWPHARGPPVTGVTQEGLDPEQPLGGLEQRVVVEPGRRPGPRGRARRDDDGGEVTGPVRDHAAALPAVPTLALVPCHH